VIRAPLEDPSYQPRHPPLPGGGIPPVVERWGPRSQLRWFTRYYGQLKPRPSAQWDRWHCDSEHHHGLCCPSCIEDINDGYQDPFEFDCCCRSLRGDS
jgi:hypothetical protein